MSVASRWTAPLPFELSLALRLRAYAVALALSFFSVPFLHLYMPADLSWLDLLAHASGITLGSLIGVVFSEAVGGLWQRQRDWCVARVHEALILLAIAVAAGGVMEWLDAPLWLPGAAEIRA